MSDKAAHDDVTPKLIANKGYLSRRSLIIAVVLTVGIGLGSIGWALNTSSAELTDQEVFKIIKVWHEVNPHLFVSQKELAAAHEVINAAIAAPHIEFDSLEDKTLSNRNTINEMKIEIAKLKIQIGGTGTPTQGTISVSVDKNCYEVGDVVHADGMATPSRQLTSSIYITKSVMEYTPTTQTQSNGSYNLFWVIPDDADLGTYTVKLKDSGGKYGEITVSVRDNC